MGRGCVFMNNEINRFIDITIIEKGIKKAIPDIEKDILYIMTYQYYLKYNLAN